MSLRPKTCPEVPASTAVIARAAFPRGHPYLRLRDALGTVFSDAQFAPLFPSRGQPAEVPWRLALVTVLQFAENLSDRRAAEAVRGRIDWKYLLGLELTDAGFDFSVLSEFRGRLLEGGKEAILLDKLLERCRELGLVKGRGKQRTDATHILAAIRGLNRLELVAETMRASLNEIAKAAPEWLRQMAPAEWYERYSRRVEDDKLPQSKEEREVYGQRIGEDGFLLLDLLKGTEVPKGLTKLPQVQVLQWVWQRHYERKERQVRFRAAGESRPTGGDMESPYDTDARFCR